MEKLSTGGKGGERSVFELSEAAAARVACQHTLADQSQLRIWFYQIAVASPSQPEARGTATDDMITG
jgi:hypothetical protein